MTSHDRSDRYVPIVRDQAPGPLTSAATPERTDRLYIRNWSIPPRAVHPGLGDDDG
jgi:hypothetical protein